MHPLSLGTPNQPLRSVLLLGAHCDDIEIGCGGTILRLIREYPNLSVHWVVFSSDVEREREARKSASAFLEGAAKAEVIVKEFRISFFPYVATEIKGYFEDLKRTVQPDIVFTHGRSDLHQDHRTLAELTWNTFRNHLILEYEIAKYEGDLGHPNFFVPLSAEDCARKVKLLCDYFPSQSDKHWFTPETFYALLRLRGIECNSPNGYAEAFHCRKSIF